MFVSRSSYSASLHFFAETTPARLVEQFGSPLYVYNERVLRERCRDMKGLSGVSGFTVCYSTKANGNPHILRIVREEGLMADAMSPGELALLRRAGFLRKDINYVSNNISPEELKLAAAAADHVSVDSLSQLDSFGRVNPGGEVMVRLNPGIGAGHHAKVVTAGRNTKFGVNPEDFDAMRAILARHNLTLAGFNQHIGSLFLDPEPYLVAVAWLLDTAKAFPGIRILDFGGGFGIPYHKYDGEARLALVAFKDAFTRLLERFRAETGYNGHFVIEPGRYIVCESGILLGSVYAVKNNGPVRYVGTDLGFSVLARPMMYDAFHDMEVYPKDGAARQEMVQSIVGNICETGDVLAKDRALPEIMVGDTVGILDAGAYGQVMSSNYNQRLRPAEVLIREDGSVRLIRRRDTVEDLLAVYPE
jgi:diaminopimelate decarboxylase